MSSPSRKQTRKIVVFLNRRLKAFCGAALIACSAILSTPALAANEAMLELFKILRDKGSLTNEEYDMLVNAAREDEDKIKEAANKVNADIEEKTKDLPKVTTKGKIKIESQDGKHSFQPIGRIFWDTLWANDDGSTAINSGSELRRIRLGFQAQFFKHWKAKLEYDFAGSDSVLKDGWISYNDNVSAGKYWFKVGQHHVPFGFHTISSSKYMSFLRRPLFADGPLSPARQYGLAGRIDNKRWLVHAGFFLNEPGDGVVAQTGTDDDAQTFAIRVAGTPWMQDKTHLLHVGGSIMHIDLQGDALRVRQRAITHIDSSRLFDTGTFASNVVQDVNAYDLEALFIYGPFHVLGEYVMWDLDNTGTGAEQLSAHSVEAGFFLTGESMKYSKGQFSGVSPKKKFSLDGNGLGAWQIVARYENMDLTDGTTIGGDGDVVSVGFNWSPIKNVRFMTTYNKLVEFERTGNANDDLEPASFSIRSLVYW